MDKSMKSEFNFIEVLERSKKAFNINNDKELAKLLKMSTASFSQLKTSNSIPFNRLFSLANKENIDFQWLITGNGEMLRNADSVDQEINAVVTMMLKMDPAQKTIIRASAENIEQLNDIKGQIAKLSVNKIIKSPKLKKHSNG